MFMVNRELTQGEVFGILVLGGLFVVATVISFISFGIKLGFLAMAIMALLVLIDAVCAYGSMEDERNYNDRCFDDRSKGLDFM